MAVCPECNLVINRSVKDVIACEKCGRLAHFQCIVAKNEQNSNEKGSNRFICVKCKLANQSDTSESQKELLSDNDGKQPTNTDTLGLSPAVCEAIRVAVQQGQQSSFQKFENMFTQFQEKQSAFNEKLNDIIQGLKVEIQENSNRISHLEIDSSNSTKELQEVKKKSADLEDKVSFLNRDLNIQEQLNLQTSLEIVGLPFKNNENLTSLFCEVSKALGVDVKNEDISNIYRVKRDINQANTQQTPIIRVKLTRQNLRDLVLEHRKRLPDFSTVNIGWTRKEKCPIYIRETLAAMNRRIYTAAFSLRKMGKIKYLWVAGGKIYYRKEDGSPRMLLSSLHDVNKIL